MCDRCLAPDDVIRLVAPDDRREPVATAIRRLRCYYQCVTQDIGDPSEDLEDVTDDDDLEDEYRLDDW